MIKVSGLTKDYGARRAIQQSEFRCPTGRDRGLFRAQMAQGKPPPCAS
jgi:hypothetical protein